MIDNRNRQSAAKRIETKDIPGWENLYSISESGDVFSKRRGIFLKQRDSMDGYKRVCLCDDKKRYEFRVHRLVAMTYIPNKEEKKEVNHIDFNKANNFISNLEWCTGIENSNHSTENKRFVIPENFKVYTFTNIYNNKSFSIIGIKNVAYQFGCSSKNFKAIISKYANTGNYVKNGFFKGLKIDSDYLKVQRLSEMEYTQVSGSAKPL